MIPAQAGQLNEYTERKEMSADVVCMGLGPVPSGEQRCRFLAVGLSDDTVRIISLDPTDCLQPLSMQALPATAESLCIVEMGGAEAGDKVVGGGLFLNIGLNVSSLTQFIQFIYFYCLNFSPLYMYITFSLFCKVCSA